MNRQSGLSLVEVSITAGLFALTLFASYSVTELSISSLRETSQSATRERVRSRVLDSLRDQLHSLSLGTLEARPDSGGQVPEVMQESTVYDNLSFRRVEEYVPGNSVFSPPSDQPAAELDLDTTSSDVGPWPLALTQEGRRQVLATNVREVSFQLSGRLLVVELILELDGTEALPARLEIALRNS